MSVLICIDLQNDFLLPASLLCLKDGMECLPSVKQAVERARKNAIPIFWVIREHDPSGIDIEWTRRHLVSGEGQGGTLPGSKGAQLVVGLEVLPGDHVMVKKRFSAFFHTHLDLMLRRLSVKTVALCGIQTPNSIRSTAVDALGLDYEVVVLKDATASRSPQAQESNLEDMRCMGVKTVKVSEWAL